MSLIYQQSFADGIFGKYRRVAERLPARGRLLEVGCHAGAFGLALQARGYEVLGLERDPAAAAAARAAGLAVVEGDVEDPRLLAGLPGGFDAILLMDVLEHLRDPAAALAGMARLLAPGGRALITGPNITYWAVRKDLLLGRWEYAETGILDKTHLRLFGAVDWRRMVGEAGFAVRRFEAAEGFLPLEHILLRLPALGRLVPVARALALARMPALFATLYLIEAAPAGAAR